MLFMAVPGSDLYELREGPHTIHSGLLHTEPHKSHLCAVSFWRTHGGHVQIPGMVNPLVEPQRTQSGYRAAAKAPNAATAP